HPQITRNLRNLWMVLCLPVFFREALDPLNAFLDPRHRRCVRNPNITLCSESRSIRDDSVFFFEQSLREVPRRLQILFQTTADIRKSIERAFRFAALESGNLSQCVQ